MIRFAEIKWDSNFIWAKAYKQNASNYWEVIVNREDGSAVILPERDYWVFKACEEILHELEKKGELPGEKVIMLG